MKFSSEIQENDIELKVRKIEEFLSEGFNVVVKVELKRESMKELRQSHFSVREYLEKEGPQTQRKIDDITLISLPNYLRIRDAESHIIDTVLLATHLLTFYLKRLLHLNWIPASAITTTDNSASILIRTIPEKQSPKQGNAKQMEKNRVDIDKFANTVRETRERERIATARAMGFRIDLKGGVGTPPVLPSQAEKKKEAIQNVKIELVEEEEKPSTYDPYTGKEENLENDKDMAKLENPFNKKKHPKQQKWKGKSYPAKKQ